jgi:hypothetical protein
MAKGRFNFRKANASVALRIRDVEGQLMLDFSAVSNSMYLMFIQDPF